MSWWQFVVDHLKASGVNEVFGTAGFLITIIGFGVTLSSVKKSKEAAQEAARAAESARNEIYRIRSFIDLTEAIAAIDEIKGLHRYEEWGLLLDRYPRARRLLIGVRSQLHGLDEFQVEIISNCISDFSALETQLSRKSRGDMKVDVHKANITLSRNTDALLEILYSMSTERGGGDAG